VGEGLRFVRGHRVIAGAFLADMNAMVLGMPFALFPAINAAYFGGGAGTLGLLTAAPAVGGILGSALSGPVAHVTRQGRAILIAGAVWGAALAGFGLARSLWLALALLVLAGAADVISVVFRTAVVQVATPDRYRGRVSAAEYVVGVGCPQLGNFRAGAVGSLVSPAFSAVSGGLGVVAGAVLIGLAVPALRRQRAAEVVPVG
jgi:MFS family permease